MGIRLKRPPVCHRDGSVTWWHPRARRWRHTESAPLWVVALWPVHVRERVRLHAMRAAVRRLPRR